LSSDAGDQSDFVASHFGVRRGKRTV
jgi:hypothetical protein